MIFINKQQTGYYRVNYDKQSWNQLINVLNSDQFEERIPVINRAQLVDDVANLARAGEVSYDVALSLMQYLKRETEYIPWSTAYNALLHLDWMFSASVEYGRFESYMRNLTSFTYRQVGLTGKLDHMSQLHRDKTLYLACYFGVPQCMSAANSVLETATLKESLDVPADLQSTVFCAFNKHKLSAGSAYEVALFYKYFLTPDKFQPLVDSFVTSLGCSRDAAMIQFYLTMVEMNVPGIPIPDALRSHILVSLIEGGPTARQAALQYVSSNFMSLSQLLPEQTIVSIFEAIGPSIISSQEYDMLEVTLNLHAESMVPSVAEAANRAVKEAEQSLSWIRKYSGTIAEWLVAQNYEGAPPDPSDNGASTTIVELSLLIGITVITHWSGL
ncbi:aminopeptidase N-like [Anopheles cruzii]|uniref:aminopeptidase N-like n=1 Tax=Anopheles cruzii TaxID=68878 RepID=UPI0022EC1B96|nr:aminopeptidase N-like [Anopheles cruzii]XP_052871183.1 aminopeptidase N-like [Anopheles cruzii]